MNQSHSIALSSSSLPYSAPNSCHFQFARRGTNMELDNDDFVLSQALDLFERSTTFNSENVTQDDLLLSQTLSEIERSSVFNDIGLLTSSQMDTFENDVQPNYFGNFQLIDFDQDFKQEEKPFINEKRERFGESVSDSDLDALVQGQRSKNTDRNTQWAYNTFEAWRKTKPGIPVRVGGIGH
jgi:hypothetical protein